MQAWFEKVAKMFDAAFISGDRWKLYLSGLGVTLEVAFFAAILGMVIGTVLAFMKLSVRRNGKKTIFTVIANIYIDVIRGTPSVLQLMIMWFIIFSNAKNGVVVAILSFGVNSGAYVAEIVRAGILAVDKGQMEAGRSLGLSEKADLRAEDTHLVSRPGYLGVAYHVSGTMDFDVEIDIPGTFSVYNSLTAIAVCGHFGVQPEVIQKALKAAKVKGRIEMVKVSDDFTLMIDYAHNAMSLESLLTTLKEYHPARLVCLFGCGGNRSKDRRYEMGEVSGRLADLSIITSDNPRFEEPQAIIDDIKVGIGKTSGKYVEICDRKEAIRYAIANGQPGDVIVLAGKGHEDYQEIKGKKYPMDERVLIAEVLEELAQTANI